ncbi:TetR/AcrR family transcriptional regulator [Rhodobacter sp. SGA-6-6]|nr:TetR/AcrR family transcriptional regulator [Rhodobacter sp. SGA-6-6]
MVAMNSSPAPAPAAENLNGLRTRRTRDKILAAARLEFVARGLEGTTMESIARIAKVNKALVYRHFTSKDLLFQEVLAHSYREMRAREAELGFSEDPVIALDQLCAFTLEYYVSNPDFLILVGIENLHKGEHIRRIPLEDLGVGSLLRIMNTVYDRGVVEGKFRPGVDPVELWLLLSSLCWFTVATSYTVDVTFGRNMLSPEELATRRGNIQEMVRRFLQK